MVVTFLALLELIRLKQIVALQNEAFGDIEICRAPPLVPPPAVNPDPNALASATAADPAPRSA